RAPCAGGVDRAGEHVGLHHHAGTAAGGRVVDRAMPVGGVVADIDRVKRPHAVRQRLAGEAQPQRAGKHLRKNRQHARRPHRYAPPSGFHSPRAKRGGEGSGVGASSRGGFTTIRPFGTSTSGTTASVNGSSRVGPPADGAISNKSPAPKFCTA